MAESNNDNDFLNSLLNSGLDGLSDDLKKADDVSVDDSDIESILNYLSKDEEDENRDNPVREDEKTKDKKKGLFSKLTKDKRENKDKKKENKKKNNKKKVDIDLEKETEEILEKTGSTSKDMEIMGLSDADLLREIDNISDIKEKDKKADKKKKKKKEKKEKRIKFKKKSDLGDGRIKIKKPKFTEPEEKVYISPMVVLLCVTVIVFVLLGVFFGGRTYRYNMNIEKASNYYVQKEYDKSYELLAGMDLKESDKGFYRQVINIMSVKKHINDFNTYIEAEKYGYALEALLRGIKCYDKNIGISNELGTVDILNSLLNDIDASLKSYYSMSMEEAREINLIDNKAEAGEIITNKAANIKLITD